MALAYGTDGAIRRDPNVLGGEGETGQGDATRSAGGAARAGLAEMRDGAQHVVDAAKEKLHDASDMVAHKAGDAKHAIEAGFAGLKQTVSKHPMASIGIAAGAGLILGVLFFRPRS